MSVQEQLMGANQTVDPSRAYELFIRIQKETSWLSSYIATLDSLQGNPILDKTVSVVDPNNQSERLRVRSTEYPEILKQHIFFEEQEFEAVGGIDASRAFEDAHGGVSYAGELSVTVHSRELTPQDPGYRNLPA